VYRLVCEVFGRGNFVLTDSDYKILGVAHKREWKGRSLKKGEVYKYPIVHLTPEKEREFEGLLKKKKEFGFYKKPLGFDMFAKGDFKKFDSFNELVDYYFYIIGRGEVIEKGLVEYEKKRKKFENVLRIQEKSVAKYKKDSEELKSKGDFIYSNFSEIEKIAKGKRSKFEFKGVLIDPKLSLNKNAAKYYEEAKKIRNKIDGAETVIRETKKKLDKLEKEKGKIVKGVEKRSPREVVTVKKEWYEKFRWFYTSNNFLAVGGKDATSNEILIKKHLEKNDLVFHADFSGSPFFVLKGGQKAKKQDYMEVAQATISYSKAWGSGLSVGDAYYVLPEQVSKEAPSGEYLKKGAFMISGKRSYSRGLALELGIGNKDGKIIGGPLSAIIKQTSNYVKVSPGWDKKTDAAKKIVKKLNIEGVLNEVVSLLPAGKSSVK